MRKQISNSTRQFKKLFKTEDTRFIMMVGFKVSGISIVISGGVYWFIFQIMKLNHAFFRSHGLTVYGEDQTFYDHLIKEALENIPVLFAFHVFLFFIGTYVGWLILRPFRTISEYCDQVIENPDSEYKVDEFSTYNLLTRFSEFFFEFLRDARKKNTLAPNAIPPQYSKIHNPVFDKIFMFHFGLLLIIIAISSAVFIIENSTSIFENMVELATKSLQNQKSVSKYFTDQLTLIDDIVGMTITLISISYIVLGIHLYEKVSGAAFGIFSTMRSFMKGNYSSRVHLVGFAYVRDYTRRLNKYLDYVQSKFDLK